MLISIELQFVIICFIDYRLRLMIIRIGDEKRQQKDDHVKKLAALIVSEEAIRAHSELIVDMLSRCVANMPHKSLLYAAITATIATDHE